MTNESATPALDRLERVFRTDSPVFRDVVERQRKMLGAEWASRFDADLAVLLPGDDETAAAVEGYSRFARELLRLQLRFERDREYAPRSFAEVAEHVYHDDSYMRSCYLPGLLLSHYLWPHQYRQLRFFVESFVSEMHASGPTSFYDIGVGTGLYSRVALTGAPEATGQAYDISSTATLFASEHATVFGVADRFRAEVRDIQDSPAPPADWLVCVEVLEHLAEPISFVKALRTMVTDRGKAFITAAINAPHADHIYHYRGVGDVMDHLHEGGFDVEQYFGGFAGPPPGPGVPVAEIAAFVVTKARDDGVPL